MVVGTGGFSEIVGLGFRKRWIILGVDMEAIDGERRKQIVIGGAILAVLTIVIVTALLGWRYLPGFLGEWVGAMVGIMSTPFFLEGSFIVLGFMTVIFLNSWRRHKEGDEFVYLEQVEGPDVPANLPDQAKWAVYRQKPLDAGELSLLDQAEGAFAIGDHAAAAEAIGAMGHAELQQPETLRLRLELAKATGRLDLVKELEREIG
jgi:hypothetical protein